jgi:hypothetical protein
MSSKADHARSGGASTENAFSSRIAIVASRSIGDGL